MLIGKTSPEDMKVARIDLLQNARIRLLANRYARAVALRNVL